MQRFKDRSTLVLQWIDPVTRKRRSRSAGTADEKETEGKRADLEYELNNGRYQEASRISRERFRELFEEEYLPHVLEGTRHVYQTMFDQFSQICGNPRLGAVNERTVSAFTAGLRKLTGRNDRGGMPSSTIKTRLQFLHTALEV